MNFLAREQVLELLSRLIEIPSVNPNLEPGVDNNELKIALYVRDWLLSHGIQAVVEEVEPGRANVFAELGSNAGPTLCLCAHLDTVGVKEMTIPPFQAQVDGNRVYGRGSCDMKGGVAAIMSAAAALAQAEIKGLEEIIFASCSDAQIEWYLDRPACYCHEDQKIAQCVKAAIKEVNGTEGKCEGWGVWTDAAVFQQAGIPTVNIGPSGFGLHEPVEWVDIDSVVMNAQILVEAAHEFWQE